MSSLEKLNREFTVFHLRRDCQTPVNSSCQLIIFSASDPKFASLRKGNVSRDSFVDRARQFLDTNCSQSGVANDLFSLLTRRSSGSNGDFTDSRMTRQDAFLKVKRGNPAAGLSQRICCHTLRTTEITAYLENGGTVEKAQQIAGHESPRYTKLYGQTVDELPLDELVRLLL